MLLLLLISNVTVVWNQPAKPTKPQTYKNWNRNWVSKIVLSRGCCTLLSILRVLTFLSVLVPRDCHRRWFISHRHTNYSYYLFVTLQFVQKQYFHLGSLLSSPYSVLNCVLLFLHPKPPSADENVSTSYIIFKEPLNGLCRQFYRKTFKVCAQIKHCFDIH